MKFSTFATAVALLAPLPVRTAAADGLDEIVSRPLARRQQETAKAVAEAVSTASSSGVHGVAVPLNYVTLSNSQGREQQLAFAIRAPGEEKVTYLLIDTGSSSMAFCPSTPFDRDDNNATSYAQCDLYGLTAECPGGKKSGANIGWVGSVHEGNVSIYDPLNDRDVSTLNDVSYAIMSEQTSFYPCDGPLGGIFGVAFSGLNPAYETPADYNIDDMMKEICKDKQGEGVFTCEVEGLAEKEIEAPLEQALKQTVEEGEDYASVFGLYCDYAATASAQPDVMLPGQGIYFGGDLALDNQFYKGGTPQTAKISKIYNGEYWYRIQLKSIRIPSMDMSTDLQTYCDPDKNNCYTDSGTSGLWLPISQADLELVRHATDEQLEGSLLVDLEGADGGTVTLSFPLAWIAEQAALGRVTFTDPADPSQRFVLGFPVFGHYYVAYNMGEGTLVFVDLPQEEGERASSSASGPNMSALISIAFCLVLAAFTSL